MATDNIRRPQDDKLWESVVTVLGIEISRIAVCAKTSFALCDSNLTRPTERFSGQGPGKIVPRRDC